MCRENKAIQELRNVLAMKATPAFIWDKFGSVCHMWGLNPFEALNELSSSSLSQTTERESPVFSCAACGKGYASQNALNAHRGKCRAHEDRNIV